jgi:hypothetical protein
MSNLDVRPEEVDLTIFLLAFLNTFLERKPRTALEIPAMKEA